MILNISLFHKQSQVCKFDLANYVLYARHYYNLLLILNLSQLHTAAFRPEN